ncbi:MAG: GNAT family N-acetyltransferase [Bacteroidota bacterium]
MPLRILRTSPDNADLTCLIALLDAELRASNGEIQDKLDQYNLLPEEAKIIVAYIDDTPVGCGSFKVFDGNTVEIKRMFVHKEHRSTGIATAIVAELEQWARELGYTHAVLETGTRLHGAVKLYTRVGYNVRAQYEQYIDMEGSVCMEKALS